MPTSPQFFLQPVNTPRPLQPAELLLAFPPGPGRILLETGIHSVPGAGWGHPRPLGARPGPAGGWSFAAGAPIAILEGSDGVFTFTAAEGSTSSGASGGNSAIGGLPTLNRGPGALALLDQALSRLGFPAAAEPRLPGHPGPYPPFLGGFAGYVAYDAAAPRPGRPPAELPVPDVFLGLYETTIALHHPTGQVWLGGSILPGREQAVARRIRAIAEALQSLARGPALPAPGAPPAGPVRSAFSRAGYVDAVRRILASIHRGEVEQVNLSQRFTCALDPAWGPHPGWTLYQRLRRHSPAPFACYLQGPGFEVASASPERFLGVYPGDGGWAVQCRPIKGTRPRGATEAEDRALARELWGSGKDREELAMVARLVRDELAGVAGAAGVRLAEARCLEPYPAVHHTVATVEAGFAGPPTPGALFRQLFPPASVTGTPKPAALAMIDALEPVRRHIYCGAIGFISLTGHMDFNVAIRTVTVVEGQRAAFHAGGGIVLGSDPEAEYEETLVKARALVGALGAGVSP